MTPKEGSGRRRHRSKAQGNPSWVDGMRRTRPAHRRHRRGLGFEAAAEERKHLAAFAPPEDGRRHRRLDHDTGLAPRCANRRGRRRACTSHSSLVEDGLLEGGCRSLADGNVSGARLRRKGGRVAKILSPCGNAKISVRPSSDFSLSVRPAFGKAGVSSLSAPTGEGLLFAAARRQAHISRRRGGPTRNSD